MKDKVWVVKEVPMLWITDGLYKVVEGGMVEKLCTACRGYHPPNTLFFYREKARTDGLSTWCIKCMLSHKKRVRARYKPYKDWAVFKLVG